MSKIIYNPYIIPILSGIILFIIKHLISKYILGPRSAELTHLDKAKKFREADLNEKAVLEATEALKIDSRNSLAWAERANAYLNLGKYKDAFGNAWESLYIEPNAMAYEIIAEIYKIFKKYDKAIKYANSALKFKARNSIALRVRAESYLYTRRSNLAIEDATASLNIEPSYHTYIIRAQAYLEKKKYDKAINDLRKALKLKPDSEYAQSKLKYAKTMNDKQFINLIFWIFVTLIITLIIIIIKSATSNLRHTPMQISNDCVEEIIRKNNFYDSRINPNGKGFKNKYREILTENDDLVIDKKSKLVWQQSGSNKKMSLQEAQDYIVKLNRINYFRFDDWRLPTLEEAMSLMEASEYNGCFINPIFNLKQYIIWTADWGDNSLIWIVDFERSRCIIDPYYNYNYVRAVRSGIIK